MWRSEGEPELWALLLDGCWPWSLPAPNGTFGTRMFAPSPQSYNAFCFHPNSCALCFALTAQLSWPPLSLSCWKNRLCPAVEGLKQWLCFDVLMEVKVSPYRYKYGDSWCWFTMKHSGHLTPLCLPVKSSALMLSWSYLIYCRKDLTSLDCLQQCPLLDDHACFLNIQIPVVESN